MAEVTGIAWTHHTFNPWWGCEAVSPGCERCYAAALDKRTGGSYWDGVPPRTMSAHNWKQPDRWQRKAVAANERRRVFSGSMCDWADKRAPDGQRDRLWQVIRDTPMLDWQLLTKRAPNMVKYLPADWGEGYDNVWLGVTVENRAHGLPRLRHLREIPARVRFISAEPLLEDLGEIDLTGIHWCIIGGESGSRPRWMNPVWAQRLIARCREQDVQVFFKQWGGKKADKGGCVINGFELKEFPVRVIEQSGYVARLSVA